MQILLESELQTLLNIAELIFISKMLHENITKNDCWIDLFNLSVMPRLNIKNPISQYIENAKKKNLITKQKQK